MEDYVPGTVRVEFFEEKLRQDQVHVEDFREEVDEYGGLSYEEALYRRLVAPDRPFNLLVLIGGLGSGKTTTIHYIQHLFQERKRLLDERYPCNCSTCMRRPIYIDNLDIRRTTPPDLVIVTILKTIRFQLYDRIMSEWIVSMGLTPEAVTDFDPGFKVLRRLMIVNDLQVWADATTPQEFPLELEVDDCHIEPLLERAKMSLQEIEGVVSEFRSRLGKIADGINKIKDDKKKAGDFTALLLGFYRQRCSADKPTNVLFIDNLDELPTETIERVVEELSYLGSVTGDARVVLPLRPSSITRRGFERRPDYMYHYGPDCYEFVLYRIEKYVLRRSLDALSGRKDDGLPSVFAKAPTQDELYAFLAATYLYGKILTAGIGHGVVRVTDGAASSPQLHKDFSGTLNRLRISEGGIRSLSQTLGALVGTCGRYAVEQLERYYKGTYFRPEILSLALKSGISSGAAKELKLGYSELVFMLLSHSHGAEAAERLANLYKPPKPGPNGDWPSLVKIRILDKLTHEGRVEAREILRSLSRYGIPQELGIAGANELHIKERLLIWFSKNTALTNSEEDLDQHVVISEHGLNYCRYVLGDFEYMWFCASEIPPGGRRAPQNFKARLEEYTRLVDAFGATEWKQIAFLKCSQSRATDESDVGAPRRMLTLSILYESLERAITSSRMSLARSRAGSAYQTGVERLVVRIARLIREAQERYRLCQGDDGYLLVYSKEIQQAREALRRLTSSGVLDGDGREAVEELREGWKPSHATVTAESQDVELSFPPKEDMITLCARFGRGIIPGLKTFVESLDKAEARRIYFWGFLRAREKLVRQLEERLPDYSIIVRYLGYVVDDAERVVEAVETTAATGSETLQWIVKEEAWLRSRLDILRDNCFAVQGPVREAEMDELKSKFNNIIGVMEQLARRCGAVRHDHLSCRWS